MRDSSKEAALATFCRPPVEAYVYITDSSRQLLNKSRHAVVTPSKRCPCLWIGKTKYGAKVRLLKLAKRLVALYKPCNCRKLEALYVEVSKLVSDFLAYFCALASSYSDSSLPSFTRLWLPNASPSDTMTDLIRREMMAGGGCRLRYF